MNGRRLVGSIFQDTDTGCDRMKLSQATWDAVRDIAAERNDQDIALMFRERNT